MRPNTKKGAMHDAVRFNVYLPREAYERLEKLRCLSGNARSRKRSDRR